MAARRARPTPGPDLRRDSNGGEPVQAATDEAAVRFSECRTLGHTWEHLDWASADVHRPGGQLAQYNSAAFVSVCRHCGTRRTKWLSRFGYRGSVVYEYPQGYQRQADQRMSLTEWRRTWIVARLGPRA
jgi:hypothetical protein